jgi:hypothetical protein
VVVSQSAGDAQPQTRPPLPSATHALPATIDVAVQSTQMVALLPQCFASVLAPHVLPLQQLDVVHWLGAVHDVGQVVAAPSQRYGPQGGFGVAPGSAGEQVPTLFVTLQKSQELPHALSQQTPSAQRLLAHRLESPTAQLPT